MQDVQTKALLPIARCDSSSPSFLLPCSSPSRHLKDMTVAGSGSPPADTGTEKEEMRLTMKLAISLREIPRLSDLELDFYVELETLGG